VRGSRLIPILVIASLLFTSIVYACSGLNSMPMSLVSAAMDHSAMEGGPCGKHHTEDICKSVRYQMLSLKASSSVPELVLHLSMVLQSAHLEVPLLVNGLPPAGPPGVLFQPVFKLSFPFFNQVLRI
jgi:hypothetical protein